jgi:hypothetical protein
MVTIRRPKNWPSLPPPPKNEQKQEPRAGSRSRAEPAVVPRDSRDRRLALNPTPDWVRSTDRIRGCDVTEGRDHTRGVDRTRGRDRTGRSGS